MNTKQSISPGQLAAMMVLYQFGTALVIPIGLEAEQSAWLSTLIALPGGLALFLLYTYLQNQFPNASLSGYIRTIAGRYIGYPICVFYMVTFLYSASRNLREAGDLLVTAAYDRTPLFLIHFVMTTAVVYVLNKGIETFFRLGQVYLVIMLSLGAIGNAAVLTSGVIDLNNLLPIQGGGWGNVLKAAYPHIWLFPFGEVVAFATVLRAVHHRKRIRRAGIVAMLLAGVMLAFSHAMQVAVLGADIYSRATFPLFTAVSMVNIGDFLQRMDAIVLLTLIIGVFFKMSVNCYAVMTIAADVFRVADERQLALPVGVVVLFGSMISAWSFAGHTQEGEVAITFDLLVTCAAIPALLFAVHIVRKQFGLYA